MELEWRFWAKGFEVINAEQLKAMMDKDASLKVINVLFREYYDDCHIKGSESVPLSDIKQHAQDWDRDLPVVVYCSLPGCPASHEAAKMLVDMGFKKVYDHEGGMKEWRAMGYPSEGPCEKDYLKD